jgi:hypothetical protein
MRAHYAEDNHLTKSRKLDSAYDMISMGSLPERQLSRHGQRTPTFSYSFASR